MSGDLIIIVFVLITAILAVIVAKLVSFWRGFVAHTRYICREIDHANSYEEYRQWRGELCCHYLCLIPFVNGKNVMRLYNKIYHRADKVKKERGDSLVPLLFPSILGIFICTVCVCGMTWAWYTASVETPAQKLTSANYEVRAEVVNGESKIEPTNGSYNLEKDITYTIKLTASGTVKECGGYCLIQNENGYKTYTQSIMPYESIIVEFKPSENGSYTFAGVWGSLPVGVGENEFLMDKTSAPQKPALSEPVSTETGDPAQTDTSAPGNPAGQPSEPTEGTYTAQSGDTLSAIAENFHTTADKIAAYNNITNRGDIKAGQVLRIPPEDYVIPETTPAFTEPPVTPAPKPDTDVTTEDTTAEANSEPESNPGDTVSTKSP